MSRTPLMLCSTTMIVVPSRSLMSATVRNTSFTMFGASPRVGSSSSSSSGLAIRPLSERQHLLLAAGHPAREVAPLLVQNGEELHDRVHAAAHLGPVPEVRASHLEVLLDGEVREQPSALGNERDAVLDDLVRGGRQPLAAPVDLSRDHGARPHESLSAPWTSPPRWVPSPPPPRPCERRGRHPRGR